MKAVEKALRSAFRRLNVQIDSEPVARAAIELARRIDAGPGDNTLIELSRELRLSVAALRELAGTEGTDDVEAFLARIAAPDLGHTAH